MVAHRAPNLNNILVHSEYKRDSSSNWLTDMPKTTDMYSCGHCQICTFVDRTQVFNDADKQKNFKIKRFINCSTTKLIYMIECPCKKVYIGKTKHQLRICIGEHLRDIKKP